MDDLLPVIAVVYLLVGVGAGAWSHRRGNHRPEASSVAKVLSSIVVGLAWPAMVMDLWLVDPDDTRGRRRGPEGP